MWSALNSCSISSCVPYIYEKWFTRIEKKQVFEVKDSVQLWINNNLIVMRSEGARFLFHFVMINLFSELELFVTNNSDTSPCFLLLHFIADETRHNQLLSSLFSILDMMCCVLYMWHDVLMFFSFRFMRLTVNAPASIFSLCSLSLHARFHLCFLPACWVFSYSQDAWSILSSHLILFVLGHKDSCWGVFLPIIFP